MKIKTVEASMSITLPTVTYGKTVIHSKSIVELDKGDDPVEAYKLARESTLTEVANIKAELDKAEASLFSLVEFKK